jgi:hypothetical protein
MNGVKWLAGHLLGVQRNLVRIGGAQVYIPWTCHFLTVQGSTEEERNMPKGEFPTIEQIRDKWNEVAPAIRKGPENVPDENSVIQIKHLIAPFNNTLAGLWPLLMTINLII